MAIDVLGDGNCLFRAASIGLYGTESSYDLLRQQVASFIESYGILRGVTSTSPDDGASLSEHVKNMRTSGVSVGEDTIVALADICCRDIHVYMASTNTLVYHQSEGLPIASPLRLAFFEPGHYMAVVDIPPSATTLCSSYTTTAAFNHSGNSIAPAKSVI